MGAGAGGSGAVASAGAPSAGGAGAGGAGSGAGLAVDAQLAEALDRQRMRASALADLLAAQRTRVPLIDPAEWRGPAAAAERAAAERMRSVVAGAIDSAVEAEEAVAAAAVAAHG